MKTTLIFLCISSAAFGQSIVVSGNRSSFSVSGSSPVAASGAASLYPAAGDGGFTEVVEPPKIILKPVAPIAEAAGDASNYVIVFTTTNCSPCEAMKNTTVPELRRRKIHVRVISDPAIAAQYGIRRFPVAMLASRRTQRLRWDGYVSAEAIMQHIGRSQPTVQSKPAFSEPGIYDGQPGSSHENRQSLIRHLVSEHAQNSAQLNGLSDTALNDLHNNCHPRNVSHATRNSVSVSEKPVGETLLPRNIVISPYGNIDLATYSRTDRTGRPCQCGMCLAIYPYQNAYREQQNRRRTYTPVNLEVGQQATPMSLVSSGVKQMKLTPGDFFCDIGCGDGRWMIAAVQASGCQAVGVEYDHRLAELARAEVTAAGLSDRIRIIEGDARDFDYSSVTAIACHLYDDLLSELAKSGTFSAARVVVAPYHEVPGLQMIQAGGVWIHTQ